MENLGPGYGARIILDSIAVANGHRLTTWELKYWRAVHDELLTHRDLSRGTASARAIPIQRMIDMIMTDPALPVHWGTNKPGMQPGVEVSEAMKQKAIDLIFKHRLHAVELAQALTEIGLHKQIINRYLQPFAFTTVIVSTVSHTNFFGLRCHEMAQAEIRHVALMMRPQLAAAPPPIQVEPGAMHLPYTTADELAEFGPELTRKISVGRCARVSYLNHNGIRAQQEDIALHDRLLAGQATGEPLHMGPFEHAATAMGPVPNLKEEYPDLSDKFLTQYGTLIQDATMQSGNFRGWKQYRKEIVGEYIGGIRR